MLVDDHIFIRADSLRGLRALSVTMDVNRDAEAHGVLADVWRSEIEATLKEAGIEVLDLQHITQVTGGPILCICLRALRFDGYPEGWACLISLDLGEWTHLARAESAKAFASTWHTGVIATAPGLNLGKLAGPLMDCVNEFVSEYRSVNVGDFQ